ncbi:MAG: hypothetical protein JW724_06815 [Candidatus Altiarchaeota archaeon]|nr:hypothetical protein [Candidatus Altiarchaeota archaeon]
MEDYLRKIGLFGIGIAVITREKAEALVNDLVKKGDLNEQEGRELVQHLLKRSEQQKNELQKKIDAGVRATTKKLDFVTKSDVKKLEKRLAALEKKSAAKKKKG